MHIRSSAPSPVSPRTLAHTQALTVGDPLRRYLEQAPISLALERAIECRLIASLVLDAPLLDLGCGDGLFATIAFARPPDVGCDLSLKELNRARVRSVYRHLVGGDGERLPFGNGTFATVVSNSTLEHVRDLDVVISEVARILQPGGRLVITVPTPVYQRRFFWSRAFRALRLDPLAALYERTVNRIFRHHHVHDPRGWADRLRRHGLQVERTIPYLSAGVVALDDVLYPVAAIGMLWKAVTGSLVIPILRRPLAAVIARLLRPLYLSDPRGDGGYVLLVARRSDPRA